MRFLTAVALALVMLWVPVDGVAQNDEEYRDKVPLEALAFQNETFRRDIPESSLRVFNQTYFVIIDFAPTP